MRLLLDTVTFLWATLDDPRLSARVREIFLDAGNELFFSVVSGWEIAVKHAAGRLVLHEPPMVFIPTRRQLYGIRSLPLDEEAALYVARLPNLHGDPFDRMLICQAIVYGLALATPDDQIAQYPVRIIW